MYLYLYLYIYIYVCMYLYIYIYPHNFFPLVLFPPVLQHIARRRRHRQTKVRLKTHTATHLQHTATHCNTLQEERDTARSRQGSIPTLQHTCNTLHHTAKTKTLKIHTRLNTHTNLPPLTISPPPPSILFHGALRVFNQVAATPRENATAEVCFAHFASDALECVPLRNHRQNGLDCVGRFVLCLAVCCSVLQCVAVRCSALQCVAVRCSALQCVAVCCSVLQCVAVCCCL